MIDVNEVPKKGAKRRWRKVLSGIPEGKALVIENENYLSAQAILNYFRCKHEFLGYSVVIRSKEGKTVTYIIHKRKNGVKATE